MFRIFPSLISANVLNLAQVVTDLAPFCHGFHLDVMDNHFVPNLTWGPLIINPIAHLSPKPVWVHLMVQDNLSIINRLELPAGSIVSFHIESAPEAIQTIITTLHERELVASIAIRPSSPFWLLEPWLGQIPHILVMSVEPGFSGQAFVQSSQELLEQLQSERRSKEYGFIIGMDGGIHADNIAMLAAQGVTDFAIASAIFNQEDGVSAIKRLKETLINNQR